MLVKTSSIIFKKYRLPNFERKKTASFLILLSIREESRSAAM